MKYPEREREIFIASLDMASYKDARVKANVYEEIVNLGRGNGTLIKGNCDSFKQEEE